MLHPGPSSDRLASHSAAARSPDKMHTGQGPQPHLDLGRSRPWPRCRRNERPVANAHRRRSTSITGDAERPSRGQQESRPTALAGRADRLRCRYVAPRGLINLPFGRRLCWSSRHLGNLERAAALDAAVATSAALAHSSSSSGHSSAGCSSLRSPTGPDASWSGRGPNFDDCASSTALPAARDPAHHLVPPVFAGDAPGLQSRARRAIPDVAGPLHRVHRLLHRQQDGRFVLAERSASRDRHRDGSH